MTLALQATCVAMSGRGILIEGAPGSGKSTLALSLIDRGAALVGDDSLMLEAVSGSLFAMPHPETRGLIEVRQVGIVSLPVVDRLPLALAMVLVPDPARLPADPLPARELLTVALPQIALRAHDAANPLRVEQALALHGLAKR